MKMHSVEGKESNFFLKRGWLFQNGKKRKHRTKSECKKKVVEGLQKEEFQKNLGKEFYE